MMQLESLYSSSFPDMVICTLDVQVHTQCKQSRQLNPLKAIWMFESHDGPALGWL